MFYNAKKVLIVSLKTNIQSCKVTMSTSSTAFLIFSEKFFYLKYNNNRIFESKLLCLYIWCCMTNKVSETTYICICNAFYALWKSNWVSIKVYLNYTYPYLMLYCSDTYNVSDLIFFQIVIPLQIVMLAFSSKHWVFFSICLSNYNLFNNLLS